jgi:hypothetical protein
MLKVPIGLLLADRARKVRIPPRGGFFSSLLKGAVGIGKALLGVPAAAPITARAVAPVVTGAAAAAAATALIPTAQLTPTQRASQAALAAAPTVRKRTRVESLDQFGQVLRTVVFDGAPFLMNKDVVAAKRVFRLASKLHGKLPRRTVKESKVAQLKDAAVETALRQIQAPKPCP